MWLYTKIGFFSIVLHEKHPDLMLVRSRFRGDLEKFLAEINRFPTTHITKARIYHTPTADYPYRMTLEKWLLSRVLCALEDTLDYTNFKDAVHGDPVRDEAYMATWCAMRQATTPRPRSPSIFDGADPLPPAPAPFAGQKDFWRDWDNRIIETGGGSSNRKPRKRRSRKLKGGMA